MTYYERQKNTYDRNAYESIEDKTERFLKVFSACAEMFLHKKEFTIDDFSFLCMRRDVS